MKVVRIIFIVLGWLSIALNIAAFLFRSPIIYYNKIKGDFDDPLWNGLGYWVGTIPGFVVGFIFLIIALFITKRFKRMPKKPLVDTLFENDNIQINNDKKAYESS